MNKLMIGLFLFGAILMPPLSLVPDFPSFRCEVFVVLLAILGGRYSGRFIPLDLKDRISKLFVYLFVLAGVAIASSYLLFQTPYNFSDFMIFPMLIQYWLIYCCAKTADEPELKLFTIKAVAAFVGLSAIIGIMQKMNILGINNWLTPYYLYSSSREGALDALLSEASYGRAVGTVGDPRHFAYVLAVGFAASFAIVLHTWNVKSKILNISLLLLFFSGLIFTASRTGCLAFVLVLMVGFALIRRMAHQFIDLFVMLGVFLLVIILMWSSIAPPEIQKRVTSTETDSFEHSSRGRIRDFFEPFKAAKEEPLILITGRGPSKAVLPGSEHSDIGWFAMRYGVLGLLCYLLLFYRSAKLGMQKYRTEMRLTDQTFAMFAIMEIAIWFLFVQAESIFKLAQLMSINMFVVGLVFSEPCKDFGPFTSPATDFPLDIESSQILNTLDDA